MSTKNAAAAAKKPEPLSQEEIDRIVASIREIGDLGARLDRSNLSRRAQLVLLSDITGLPMTTIKKVLDGLVVLPMVALKARS